jgi:DNA-binding protein H-NS
MENRISRMEFALNEKSTVELLSRFSDLEEQETQELSARAAAAFSRFEPETVSEDTDLSAKIEQLMHRFND